MALLNLIEPTSAREKTSRSLFIQWFKEVSIEDIPSVGGKNASLGEMYRALAPAGIKVPNGFAITSDAYWKFLRYTGLDTEIDRIIAGLDSTDLDDLRRCGSSIRHLIMASDLPPNLEETIIESYESLRKPDGSPADVAVRSSATAEDLPDASFAGQQETFLNIQGATALIEACKRCYASLYTDRAISYRIHNKFEHSKVALSIGIQQMVRSDLGTSGVMFTIDTDTGFKDVVLINASYGLGENVVQGIVNPDEFTVFKPTLREGFEPILNKRLGTKEFKLIYDIGGGKMVKNVPVPGEDRDRYCLSNPDILALARWAMIIEEHYSAKRGVPTPMDIEWAKDGQTGELFILQARPETVQARKQRDTAEIYHLSSKGTVLLTGRSVGGKIASGRARIIKNVHGLHELQPGEILVTDRTDPDWEPVMKKAAAIITNRGGRTCHAAIVSRELGLPAVIGTGTATTVLQDGQEITVSCAEGETGFVYSGQIPFHTESIDLRALQRPKTKVMLNAGNPDEAFALSFLPNDGVGLAREEFIISNHIRIHPLALLNYHQLEDAEVISAIDALTKSYPRKDEFFVEKLAEGVATIAAAFYPKDVIVRLSDFKTNEYANLIGGKPYEPSESNPMLGFRGASRYYDARYRDGFALECRAMRKVRSEMGLRNLKLMIPFCRTIEEARLVQSEMEKNGLKRGVDDLELYVMCEIPSNVVLAEGFCECFDGFSIGSNDLTQLVLGVDRDSEIVAHVFDERNPAVKAMIAEVIRTCRKNHRKIGICGQAPSDYPEFAEFLVEHGIDSISLNPDTILKTTATILQKEQRLAGGCERPIIRG